MVKKPILNNTIIPLLLGVVMVVGFALSPAYGQAVVVTERLTIPLDYTDTSCSGEPIHITGSYLLTFHITQVNAEKALQTVHQNYQGAQATGLTSGQQYQVIAAHNSQIAPGPGGGFTLVSPLRIVSQGPGNDYVVYYTIHASMNANGEPTAYIEHVRVECT
jgi:hypothetical protein